MKLLFFSLLILINVIRISCNTIGKSDLYKSMGGQYAKNEFHWSARLFQDFELECSGVAISKRWAISEAHCFDKYEPNRSSFSLVHNSPFQLKLGWTEEIETPISIKHVYRPEEYINSQRKIGDIALLELEFPNNLNDQLGETFELLLSEDDEITSFEDKTLTLVSWGWISAKGDKPKRAKKMNVKESYCQSGEESHESIFCGNIELGTGFTCEGDSGGALIYDGKLIGILECGVDKNCSSNNRYNTFTKVSFYRNFIKSTMEHDIRVESSLSRHYYTTTPIMICLVILLSGFLFYYCGTKRHYRKRLIHC